MAKRVLLGKKGSEYGLYISKPGVDVTTTTSAKDLLFNSGATTTVTGSSPTTSEKSFRSGVIVNDTTLTTLSAGATKTLPSTLGSDNNYYIPAYQIVENGVRNPTSGYDETRSLVSGITYEIESDHLSGLPSNSGGGLWELTTAGSGANINAIEAKQIDATQYENSNASSFAANYPWITDRAITTNDSVSVDILMLRIPCQYGKMEIDALFNTTTQPTPSTSGGGGSGGSPSAPTISSVSRIARDANNDTVRISASNGSNNSGTITYGVNTSNSAPTSFQSSTDFTQPRNSTRYYFAKQGGVTSSGTQYDAAAVDTTPSAFTFTTKNSATAGQSYSQASSAIAGLADGDSAAVSVSGGTVNVSSVVNGGTVIATGTAAAAPAAGQNPNSTVVTVTIGGVQSTFTINTPAPAADTDPDAFGNFTAVTGSQLNTVNTSTSKTITGINTPTAVTISGNGTFSIAGGAYGTTGNISNNQSITVRLTSSGSYSTAVSTTLTIGGGNKQGIYTVTTRAVVAATTPTDIVATQTTNTSASSQNLTVTGSGGSGTTQVSSNNSSWVSNGSTFSQSRNSTVTYYARNVGETTSSSYSETKFIPPVVSGISANVAAASLAAGGVDDTYSPSRGAGFTNYSSYWGTVTTSISNNSVGGWLTTSITNSSLGYYRVQTSANSSTSARSATVTYTTFTQFGHQHVYSYTFIQAGIAVDTTPDAFSFSDVTTDDLNTDKFANDQITGINTATNATYSGDANGSFSVTGISGTYNQSAKSVSNGTQIHVKLTSSPSNSTARNATITVGGVSDTFTVTTGAASDGNPDQFSFTDETGADATTVYQDSITLAGMNTSATATMSSSAISGFKVNSGSFGTGSQTVNVGDIITVFVRSAAGSFQSQSATITVGTTSDTFSVTTGNTGGGGGIE
jgi:hypothetical protein